MPKCVLFSRHTFLLPPFYAQCVDIIKWLTYFCLHTKMYAHINHLYIHRHQNQTHKASVCRKTDRRKCGEKSVLFPQTVVFHPLSHPLSSLLRTKKPQKRRLSFPWYAIVAEKITLMILVVDESVRAKEKKAKEEKEKKKSARKFFILPFRDKVYILVYTNAYT